ncbi:putative methyltransferase DDB_G0268948 isoform X1 [Zootoca vivipara]|uniref:putative methyltransferase DDB_G0268948 isoform X1 n=2 Tax=Zootoca vivipara TaxID=8524 RepID=UPI00293BE346|nr:putative methyltransferase DDB_G0268948 isoform X1 [Zootoca vivipara]XP_034995118.2 putative methyltransferase DDB_G0268948 isoform X1 [Zootoca vivipara]
MATRLFEDRAHAAFYQKYRFSPQKNLQGVIFSYLEEKRVSPGQLAVDVGCGSGQSTRMLAKHFEKVVGTDISEAQIEEARRAPHPPNVSYLVCPAEELPFEDGSVDLVTAFAAAHWFDGPRFLREVDRVLKPSGCVVFSSYNLDMRLCYKDCSDELTEIFREIQAQLFSFRNEKIELVENNYQEIFDSLPFQEKKRMTDIFDKIPLSVADVIGFIQSLSPYRLHLDTQPEEAKSLLQNSERRFLETMGVSSRDTQLELRTKHVCILGCKSS